jgi:serine O-acetyltransferase
MPQNQLLEKIPGIVGRLVESIHELPTMQRLNRVFLPSRDAIVSCTHLLFELLYPGYFGRQGVTVHNLPYRTGELVTELVDLLYEQVRHCLRYRENLTVDVAEDKVCEECDREATRIVGAFLDQLPSIREVLSTDVQAAFESDPAATSTDETIFSYPGLYAISTQRMAHALHKLGVPLLPRIMTEHAHSVTGIDIHPGAQLGRSFFIDHGTGVVIGETTIIGNNVTLYQGVTLGALAPAYGQALRGQKRHPTIEDDVVIYAGATILGGDTVIGRGSVIGGNVFITQSVPPNNRVVADPPALKYRARGARAGKSDPLDFQI